MKRIFTKNPVKCLAYSGICLALSLVLPFFTGQIPDIGRTLCPMHIPVLLCGFICGPWWGMAVGAVAPLLRSLIFIAPAMPLPGVPMCFELAAYGFFAGMLYACFAYRTGGIYITLVGAMLLGRCVWGAACFVIYRLLGGSFTWHLFVAGAFLDAVPGILLQLVLIPALVLALRRTGAMKEQRG